MTKSFDELFAPKAMSLDELFAAIQPPPLLPVSYPPSGNIDFMSPSFAGGVNAPQPIPLNQFMPRTTPAPHDTYNFGYPGSGVPGNGNDEALASIESDDMLNHILARQAAGLRPLPDYSLAVQTPQQDRSWPGVQPAPLQQLNYPSAPGNPSDDTGLSPLDDWQKRGSETAASALSIPYPKDGPLPAAANQLPSAGNGLQPIPPDRLWAGIQTAPLGLLDYPTTTSEAPSHPAGQQNGNDAELLARLIFAEAGHEYDRPGVYDAIAHTVLNRVGQPGFRSNLRDVIFMPKQFASVGGELWNKAADPSTLEPENARAYARALSTANEALSGRGANLTDPTHGATYFYSGKATQPPGGFFSDRIRSGVLERTEEYPPFVFWKDVRQGQR